ncbi:MAG: O-antigen ligase family protein [Anaerolineales bacterium]|nr:O-antigen ligase family protein [Anaerolineales bacterium]
MISNLRTGLQRSAAWVAPVSLGSLLLIAPLLLFPRGVLPFLALGLALLVLLWRWAVLGWPQMRVEDVPLFILLGMALLGLGISVDQALSWPRLWSIVLGALIFFELRRSLRPSQQAAWIVIALALAGLGMAGISLVGTDWDNVRFVDLPWLYDQLPTLVRGLPGSGVQSTSDLFNPRWVGITMGVLAPCFLPLLAWRERPWLRLLAAVVFLVDIGTLLLTQSIQGLLGLLAGSFIVLLFINRRFWLLLPAGVLAAVGLTVWLGPDRVGMALLSMDNPGGAAIALRLDIWSRAWAMLLDMPFTGIGLNTFPLIQSQFYTGYLIGPEPHAHNLYLQTALDLGLPGLVAFLWFVTVWVVQVLRRLGSEPISGYRLLLIGALAGVVSYLAHGAMDAMMLGAKPSFVVWALLGIGAALPAPQPTAAKTKPLTLAFAWLALPLAFGLVALLRPASVFMNLGALQTQSALYPFPLAQILPGTDLTAPQANLERALGLEPSLRQAHLLLGRIASLQGDFPAALQHYSQRVALDMDDPLANYDPAQKIQQWLDPQSSPDPAAELGRIYQAWNTRFPERAEGYLLKYLLASQYQADPGRGQALLQAGLQANAQPLGLLEYLLEVK